MKKLCLLAAIIFAVSGVQAGVIDSSFTNLDFDASTQSYFPGGFDNATYDIPGWQDTGADVDSGIQAADGWWGNYDNYSAFMKSGDDAFNLSTYTIQSGDQFDLSFYAKGWSLAAKGWGSDTNATLTVSLFYGGAATNVIGSYTTPILTNSNASADYALYQTTITASGASVGQTLGVLVESTGVASSYATFDEVSINVIPEPATIGLVGIFGAGLLFIRRKGIGRF